MNKWWEEVCFKKLTMEQRVPGRVYTGQEFPDRERHKACPVPAGKFRSGISEKSGQNSWKK